MSTTKGSTSNKKLTAKTSSPGRGKRPAEASALSAEQLATLVAAARAGEEAVSQAEQTVAAVLGTGAQEAESRAIDSETRVTAAARTVAESVSSEVGGKL